MRRFGLIGRSLGHSLSARYFADKFVREGIADCDYALYELPRIGDLPRLLAATPELCGFNVTIPYKQEIIPYLDALDDEAGYIGAVNCVRREADGRLIGYNTDAVGLRQAFSCLLDPDDPPRRALVLGTGGASVAVQYVLAEQNIPCDLVSRDAGRGQYTYDELCGETLAAHRLIVNATPVGTFPDTERAPSLPYAFLTPEHCLLDLVYNPPLTRFLAYGRDRGARIQNGEPMFWAQAESAWRIWNG